MKMEKEKLEISREIVKFPLGEGQQNPSRDFQAHQSPT